MLDCFGVCYLIPTYLLASQTSPPGEVVQDGLRSCASASCIGALLCEIFPLSLGKPRKRHTPCETARTPWCSERCCWCCSAQRVWVHVLAWVSLGVTLDKQLQLYICFFSEIQPFCVTYLFRRSYVFFYSALWCCGALFGVV